MRLTKTNHRPGRPSASPLAPSAFTLVELLVVITIIALLAGLLLAAAGPAITSARRAAVNAGINQMNVAIEDLKNNVGAYPPNAQTDGGGGSSYPLDENVVLSRFERFFNKAFPSHREPPQLIRALVGLSTLTPDDVDQQEEASNLPGGMNAAESLVFWIGGFSEDPKYPISGPGGPSYSLRDVTDPNQHREDPVASRTDMGRWNITQLGPRTEDNFFAGTRDITTDDNDRYIVYVDPRDRANNTLRRINFWYMTPANSEVPYVYFDASRGNVIVETDAPAHTGPIVTAAPDAEAMQQMQNVFAVKTGRTTASGPAFNWANDGKFQVLHCGTDDEWGVLPSVNSPEDTDPVNVTLDSTILYADGPWTLELADTQSNFTSGATLEADHP